MPVGAGHPEAAVRLLRAAEALPLLGMVASPSERTRLAALAGRARAGLGGPAFDGACTRGRFLTPEQALAEALAWAEALADQGEG